MSRRRPRRAIGRGWMLAAAWSLAATFAVAWNLSATFAVAQPTAPIVGPPTLTPPAALAPRADEGAPVVVPPALGGGGEPLLFRRLYAPADAVSQLARDCVPMRRDEFESLVAALKLADASPAVGASLAQTELFARAVDGQLIDGRLRLTVAHRQAEPAFLRLDPCRLPLTGARWADAPDEPAVIGLNRRRESVLLVDRSGVVDCGWTLRGQAGPAGGALFRLRLPPAPVNRLWLAAPAGATVEAPVGVVRRAADDQRPPPELLTVASHETLWLIELGAGPRSDVRVGPATPLAAGLEHLTPTWRQSLQYEFDEQGAELAVTLQADAPLTAGRLELEIDAGLTLVGVQQGAEPAPWTAAGVARDAPQRVVLELATGASAARSIRLAARGPVRLDQPWRLPAIRLTDGLWREGEISLGVADPLMVSQLETTDCRQTKVGPLAGPPAGETIGLQMFLPTASAVVTLQRRPLQAAASVATVVEIGESTVSGRLAAELLSAQGELFQLEATLARPWTVDSVEALAVEEGGQPYDVLDDWSITPRGSRPPLLQLRLRQALTPERRIWVLIRAQRRAPAVGDSLPLAELRLAEFALETPRRWLAARADPPLQLAVAGDAELRRGVAAELPAWLSRLLAESPGATLYVDDRGATPARFLVNRQAPRLSVEAAVELEVEEPAVRQTVRLRCQPESSHVNRLEVHFTCGWPDEPVWMLADGSAVAARRAPVSSPLRAERWEVDLLRPQHEPFELVVTRSATWREQLEVPLPSVPEAVAQTGLVTAVSSGGTAFSLVGVGLQPRPTGDDDPLDVHELRARRQYQPAEESSLSIVRNPNDPRPAAIAWQGLVDTEAGLGAARHVVRWDIENAGRKDVTIQLPVGCHLREAAVDGRPTPLIAAGGAEGQWILTAPEGRRFFTLSLEYVDGQGLTSAWSQSLATTFPTLDIPVLSRRWRLRLPPGYQAASSLEEHRSSWSRRLFGVLARHEPPAEAAPEDTTREDTTRAAAAAAPSPWRAALDGSPETPLAGWELVELPVAASGELSLRVVRPPLIRALGWSLLLAACAVAHWWASRRPAQIVAWAAVAGVVALLAPAVYAPLATGVWGGCLLAGALLAVERRRRPPPAPPRDPSSTLSRTTAGALLGASCWLVAVAPAGLLLSAWTAAAAQRGEAKVYGVVFPVDDDLAPSGPYVQVPEELYDALHRRYAELRSLPQDWLLLGATYRCQLAWSADRRRLVCQELVAEFDLHVVQASGPLRLPLPRAGMQLLEGGARIDGVPFEPVWDEADEALLAPPPPAGRTRIELAMRPSLTTFGELEGMMLNGLAAPTARLTVNYPLGAAELSSPEALGRLRDDPASRQLTVELGPVSRWSLRWPAQFGGGESGATVDQLAWLRVRPGSVVADLKCRWTAAGPLSSVRLEVDPRWKLLSIRTEPPLEGMPTRSSDGRLLRLQLSESAGAVSVQASFLLTDAAGVGVLRPPRLAADSPRFDRRWLAISIDPLLQHALSSPAEPQLSPLDEFAAAWGAPATGVTAVYRGLSLDGRWRLDTRPQVAETTGVASVHLSIDDAAADFAYQADLETLRGSLVRLQLTGPAGAQVRGVRVVADGASRLSRWSQAADGVLTIFLAQPTSGKLEVAVIGRLPVVRRGATPVPRWRLREVDLGQLSTHVYRRPGSLVRIRPLAEDLRLAADAGGFDPQWGRHVASWSERPLSGTSPAPASAEMVLEPNPARFTGRIVTSLWLEGETWLAETLLEIEPLAGVLDTVVLDTPVEWSAPLVADPDMELIWQPAPSSNRRRLIIRPPLPIDQPTRLRLRGPLLFAAGERPRAPNVDLVGGESVSRLLALPTQLEGQPLVWSTPGLQLVDLDPPWREFLPRGADGAVYEAISPAYRAALRPLQRQLGEPQVRLADLFIAITPDQQRLGAANFDLDPAGLSYVDIVMPPAAQLLEASIGQSPALLTELAPSRWRVTLISQRLPQRLSLLFTAPADAAAGPLELAAPELLGVPIERTMWTIAAAPGQTVSLPPGGPGPVSAERQELFRRQAQATLVDLPADVLAETPADELGAWYLPWARRLAATAHVTPEAVERDEETARRLGLADLRREVLATAPTGYEPSDLWLATAPTGATLHVVQHGSAARLAATAQPWRSAGDWPSRLAASGVLLVGASVLLLLLGLRSAAFWTDWGHAAWVLLGIAWLAWLSPAWVGGLIVALSLISTFRWPWRPVRHGDASTILRRR